MNKLKASKLKIRLLAGIAASAISLTGLAPSANAALLDSDFSVTLTDTGSWYETTLVGHNGALGNQVALNNLSGSNWAIQKMVLYGLPTSYAGGVSNPPGGAIDKTLSGPSGMHNLTQIASYESSLTQAHIGICWIIEMTGSVVKSYCSPTVPNGGGGTGASSASETPTPAKYSGPEFSGLSGMGIMTGSTGKLEGKRLDQISSIEIGGEAATFTATSAAELELSLPAGLAPGLYDLVINSSAGKLTHINAIQVREPKQSFSITTRSTGKISEEQYLEHSLIAAMQAPELNKARCIVNASTQAMAEAMAKRLCAIVKASKPNIETTVVVPRSTVRNDTVFARVIYGWN
jgi:hypothetical protein